MRITLAMTCFLLFTSMSTADDLPPGVVDTQNAQDISLTPQDSLSRISVPDGFRVTLFAGEPDIRRPIAFDFDDRGRLWVVENYSHPHWKQDNATDRIVILEDTDNDGQFDNRTIFFDKGRYLTGIAVGHGGVWLANTPELTFIPDRNGDDRPDSDPEVMLDGFQISTNNVLNNFHWGPDGWLYGAIGLSTTSLVGKPGTPKDERTPITRGLWRFHPVTQQFQKLAEGMVNPWGADFNEFGDLFTANTVLAHLWHIVPGMYCERRVNERDNLYAYRRIQSITNHLHWGGGQWQTSRNPSSQKRPKRSLEKSSASASSDQANQQYHQHSVAGGGHAHCGAMIYLGDNWPKEYYGTFFTNNLHGNRINNDRLVPHRSTYVGTHADDLMLANDPWFRGMQIKYGPDGGVYVSDWHDIGECHDTDGSHRSSGRIYKITYGHTHSEPFELAQKTDLQLAELHSHSNEWFVRHARRLLHERSLTNVIDAAALNTLQTQYEQADDVLAQLRALWTLQILGKISPPESSKLLRHENEHIRRWGIRFVSDAAKCGEVPDSLTQNELARMAVSESSPKVRLELAGCLPSLQTSTRLKVAEGLLQHADDATDPYIPLMVWYGLEPIVPLELARSLEMARKSQLPLLRNFIYRRICDEENPPLNVVLESVLQLPSDAAVKDAVQGIADSLSSKDTQFPPAIWKSVYARHSSSQSPALNAEMLRLAVCFGDSQVIAQLRSTVTNPSAESAERQQAFQSLSGVTNGLSLQLLHTLLQQGELLRPLVLQALVTRSGDDTGNILMKHFADFSEEDKTLAVAVMVTRETLANQLLDGIASKTISRDVVSPYALQQLRSFPAADISERVAQLWADDQTSLQKGDELARLATLMTPDHIHAGNAGAGRLVWHHSCARCHRLFGEGGTIAPDLTGSGRKKPDYVLRNLIDPSEEIDAAYRLTTVITTDGRLFSGFIVKQDDNWLHLRTQDASVQLNMNKIDELSTSNVSMMPEGMWKILSDEQIRNLLTYLASDEQVNLPSH